MASSLAWLESTPFSTWLKESPSLLAYPAVLFLHSLGLILTAGLSAIVCLRLLGLGRGLPLASLDRLFRVIWIGFWASAVSGFVMVAVDATAKLANPLFTVKMVFVIVSAALMVLLRRRVVRADATAASPARGRLLAAASLACWVGAIAAGRFMAYF
jgi:hypothetical protein